jgi:hypothetical protein
MAPHGGPISPATEDVADAEAPIRDSTLTPTRLSTELPAQKSAPAVTAVAALSTQYLRGEAEDS